MKQSIATLQTWPTGISFDNTRTWALLILSLVLLGAMYMGLASQAAITGQRLHDKQDRLARVAQENAQLEADIATLLAPARIEARARALGLHPASPDQIKYLLVKNFPVDPATPAATGNAASATETAGGLDPTAWLNGLLGRLGLGGGPRSAEATTGP